MIVIKGGENRPTRDQTYIAVAEVLSLRGMCRRGKVGSVITLGNRIVSTGYNGPIGECIDSTCDISKPCEKAIHAEANAIAFAAKYGIALGGATLYCTTQPCRKCAELIFQCGIKKVVYEKAYRDDLGTDFLKSLGIEIIWI